MSDPHATWKDAHGDETYALDWDIGPESLVWEIGGFTGRWAAQIVEKFDPRMEIYEPQEWAVRRLEERFKTNSKVSVFPYGLWVCDAMLPMSRVNTDGASMVRLEAQSESFLFQDVYTQIDEPVDLCLMNIEGAEYALLSYMIELSLMKNFRYFWCQFHPGVVADAERKFFKICEGMERTHRTKWSFYPTAVAWERK